MRSIGCIAVLGWLLTVAPADAHHSFAAEFDADKPVKLTGTVTKVEWANPHVWFYVDVTDAEGKVTNWAWETDGPTRLLREGWTRNSMKVGDVVTVEGFRAKKGTPTANTASVTLTSTGQRLFTRAGQEK